MRASAARRGALRVDLRHARAKRLGARRRRRCRATGRECLRANRDRRNRSCTLPRPRPPSLIFTFADSRSDSSSSSRRVSRPPSFAARAFVAGASLVVDETSFSVSRTDMRLLTTWLASWICVAASTASSARAWPMSRSPASSIVWTGVARFSRRSRFDTALRERPTDSAACSCVKSEFVEQTLDALRLFQRIQILALDVFDQRHRGGGLIRHVFHEHRHFVEAGECARRENAARPR